MKKAKGSFEAEIEELDYSKDLGIELDDSDSDEIIDLEDIVELPEEGEGSDELNLDVELLDVDSDLDLSDFDAKLKGSGTDDLLDDDLLKEFGSTEEEKAPAKPVAAPAPAKDKAKDMGDILGQGSIDDLLSEFAMSDGPSLDFDAKAPAGLLDESAGDLLGSDSSDLLGGGAGGLLDESTQGKDLESLMDFDNDLFGSGKEARSAVAREPAVKEEGLFGKTAPTGDSAALDDFVAQIENRLVQTIREVVEARLPDIVRTVLREEIEKLKKEL